MYQSKKELRRRIDNLGNRYATLKLDHEKLLHNCHQLLDELNDVKSQPYFISQDEKTKTIGLNLEKLNKKDLIELLRENVALGLISENALLRIALYKWKARIEQKIQNAKDDKQRLLSLERLSQEKRANGECIDEDLLNRYHFSQSFIRNKINSLEQELQTVDSLLMEFD